MEDFIEIDDSRTVDIDDYICNIVSPEYRNAVCDMFNFALPFLSLMENNFAVKSGIPPVMVKTTPRISAEVSPLGFITVSEGIINHCLNVQWPQANEILGRDGPYVLGGNLIAQLGMCWVLGHEFTHLFRMHHLVEREVGNTKRVLCALEHDADLCAAAGVFRLLQRIFNQSLDDDGIRKYTIFAIFWIIRSIPETNDGAGLHPSFSERFFQIVVKVASLQKDASEVYDPDLKLPRSKHRAKIVRETALACESAYQSIKGYSDENYFKEWQGYFERKGHTQIIWDWIKISDVVERVSGLQADVKQKYVEKNNAKKLAKKKLKLKRKAQAKARSRSRV